MKALNRLWLRTAKKITRAQQARQKKIVKILTTRPPERKSPKTSEAPVKPVLAPPPLPGKWLSSFYRTGIDVVPPRRLQYWLYLPSSMGDAPIPLVVMLHGCAQTATQFAQGTGMNRLAEAKGFAVLYPQQALNAHPNRCWVWYDKATQDGGGAVRLITGAIAGVVDKYPIDRRRIYIAGMSAGASMANIVALNNPHLFAAVGLHSGAVFGGGHSRVGAINLMQHGELKPVSHAIEKVVERFDTYPTMPAILIHGSADKVVRPVNLAQLTQQFCRLNRLSADNALAPVLTPAKNGRRRASHAFVTVDYVRDRKPIVRACDIHQLEHAWSGGDGSVRFHSSTGPDAAHMIWRFFARHRRPAAATAPARTSIDAQPETSVG